MGEADGEERRQREITDEDIRRMRARIDVEIPHSPHYVCAGVDAIRHWAEGIGDDNPLYSDPEYAAATRWGGIVAPPRFIESMGVSRIKAIPPDVREQGRGALSGIHSWYSGDTFEFLLPVHVGDRMMVKFFIANVLVKTSEFAGRTVHIIRRYEWVNQRGELVATADRLDIAGGREKTQGERRKYADITRQRWTAEQIETIAAEYRAETRRGAETRYWEGVMPGETLPRRVKGPLTVTDMIRWNMGKGSPFVRAHKISYAFRDRHPNIYPVDEYGVPDVAERCHWEDAIASKTGNPAPYDYGPQRLAWMSQVVTDWMGNDGFIRRTHGELRQFNYVGDVTYCQGVVENAYVQDGERLVRVRLWGEDQRGRTTCQGWAEVALPSREAGPVRLVSGTRD